ncbi:MAG: protease complex subunit PrcB family protein, partial [archaeon]|nr:protease complex subunit PrcB family protein [archaeon]
FFEAEEIMQCVADAPSKNLQVSFNGMNNSVSGIGLECPDEQNEKIGEIIERIEVLTFKVKFYAPVESGSTAAAGIADTLVIKNAQDWEDFWNGQVKANTQPVPQVPELDFSSEMVVAVLAGNKKSGGYGVKIKQMVEQEDSILVIVENTSPGNECEVTTAITSPYEIVSTQKTGKAVEFEFTDKISEC